MFKLNTKLDADSLLYSLSHFECDGHTVHKLTQQCLLFPMTSTVKSSLLTHVHSSPLSLAARSHRCCANLSCYINSGWMFSRQTHILTGPAPVVSHPHTQEGLCCGRWQALPEKQVLFFPGCCHLVVILNVQLASASWLCIFYNVAVSQCSFPVSRYCCFPVFYYETELEGASV